VSGRHLRDALDDLLHRSVPIVRSLLGANPHVGMSVEPGSMGPAVVGTVGGWFAYAEPSVAPEDEW
jgi:hypothetical protein